MISTKKRRIPSTNSTGYRGVAKSGKRFFSRIRVNGKTKSLGGYDTAKEAALAFDRAVVLHKLPTSKLNFPDGLPIDDEDYEELMNPKPKEKKLASTNTSGYTGVYKKGNSFRAQIRIDRKKKYLGTFATSKAAALAFDRAVTQHKLQSSSRLNFPDGLPLDDEDYEELMNPKKKRRLKSNNTTGYNGVSKNGKRFQAKIGVDGKTKNLGTYDTPKEAALAFDRAVIDLKLPSYRLNFSNDYTTSSEDDDDNSNDASDAADSDGKTIVGPSPFPPAQSIVQVQGDPMLEHLVAAVEAQTNK